MAPRYDRLFYVLLVILLVGGYSVIRDSVRQIVADVAGVVHSAAVALAYQPEDNVGKLAVLAMFLIVVVAALKLLTRDRGPQGPDQ